MTMTDVTTTGAGGTNDEEAKVLALCKQLLDEIPPSDADPVTFLGRQFDLGLAWVNFPEGHGGLGIAPSAQKLVNETLTAAGAPLPYGRNPIGYGMGAPTVAAHGSEEQKRRYLRPLFTGEEIWCQLFSEPGAGSDLAALQAQASYLLGEGERPREDGLIDKIYRKLRA